MTPNRLYVKALTPPTPSYGIFVKQILLLYVTYCHRQDMTVGSLLLWQEVFENYVFLHMAALQMYI